MDDPPTISFIPTQTTDEDVDEVVNFTIDDVDSVVICDQDVNITSSNTSLIDDFGILIEG